MNNNFNLVIDNIQKSTAHLKDRSFFINVEFDNSHIRTIEIKLSLTNHLFTKKIQDNEYKHKDDLQRSGHWITTYKYKKHNYQQIILPPTILEHRLFCLKKYNDSFRITEFINQLAENPKQFTVLANSGDHQTLLSASIDLHNRSYLVFFKLHKINSKAVTMLVLTAYSVDSKDYNIQDLTKNRSRKNKKPFLIVIKNVMEGRNPHESLTKKNSNHKRKKSILKRKKP